MTENQIIDDVKIGRDCSTVSVCDVPPSSIFQVIFSI